MILGKLWRWAAAGLAVLVAGLYAMLRVTEVQRDRARDKADQSRQRADTAEARLEQRQAADKASREAKEAGDAAVDKARDRARSGKRDHFTGGM